MKNYIPSAGKIYRLQRCTSPSGQFVMLALDHRNNLVRSFNPKNPEAVPYKQMTSFKRDVVASLSETSTGVLLDPEYGVGLCIARGAISPDSGLLVAVEKTGYSGDSHDRRSQILPGWGVEKIARLGAAGVKLLIYYHPDSPNASGQEALVREVAQACKDHDIPFFLEPLSFSLDPAVKKMASPEKRRVVVETARRLTRMDVDVLKAEFPLNPADAMDETEWADACAELSEASAAPWILLSAGVGFETFERQTKIACQNGASGVLAGRAVWKEAVALRDQARTDFLRSTAKERMIRLQEVILKYGRPWMDFYPDLDNSFGEGWYKTYR
jgi:tagatose 1,6-diphosphate aldolase